MGGDELARRRVGTTIKGKWRIERLLGTGGMAAVYAATHRNGDRVAIKMLHPEVSIHEEIKRRFLREGRVANAVQHDGAVRVRDDDETEDGAAFLVMDLLDGETLEELWKRNHKRLDLTVSVNVVSQLLEILAAAHERGIIHRDIKPANLFITSTGQVKVLDFGIARLHDTDSASLHTATGAVMGTPGFMAPEQARGLSAEIDAQTDLWAVGATLFSLLTGRLTHEGRSVNERLVMAATTPVAPLATIEPNIPPSIGAVVDRALAFEKKERWGDARNMRAALMQAVEPNRASHSQDATLLLATLVSPANGKPQVGGANHTAPLATLPVRFPEGASSGNRKEESHGVEPTHPVPLLEKASSASGKAHPIRGWLYRGGLLAATVVVLGMIAGAAHELSSRGSGKPTVTSELTSGAATNTNSTAQTATPLQPQGLPSTIAIVAPTLAVSLPKERFSSGERLRLSIKSNTQLHLVILSIAGDGTGTWLSPTTIFIPGFPMGLTTLPDTPIEFPTAEDRKGGIELTAALPLGKSYTRERLIVHGFAHYAEVEKLAKTFSIARVATPLSRLQMDVLKAQVAVMSEHVTTEVGYEIVK